LNVRLNCCFVMIERTFTNFNGSFASETDLSDATRGTAMRSTRMSAGKC
jgi:hypothetical protein